MRFTFPGQTHPLLGTRNPEVLPLSPHREHLGRSCFRACCPQLSSPTWECCVRACSRACVLPHIARDQDGPVERPPDCPFPVRAIGAHESPLRFQKQKILFTINIPLKCLINSSRPLKVTGQWLRGQSSRYSCSGQGRSLGFLNTAVVSCVPQVCPCGCPWEGLFILRASVSPSVK